jgi:hypothetical protein
MAAQVKERKQPTPTPDLWSLLAFYLVFRHRRQQEDIADRMESDMARTWTLLKFHDLAGSELQWLDASLDKIQARYAQSQRASAGLVNDLRKLNAIQHGWRMPSSLRPAGDVLDVDSLHRTILAPDLDEGEAARRLLATGPGTIKHAMPAPEDLVAPRALSNAVGAAVELAGGGGRSMVLAAANHDDTLIGYQRVCESDGRVCSFCALLASRGPDFHNLDRIAATDVKWSLRDSEAVSSVPALDAVPDSTAKVHAHCRCTLIPVFESGSFGLAGWGTAAETVWTNLTKTGDWKQDRRKFGKAFDAYKASNPNAGADDGFERHALKRALADDLRDRTDYESARFLRAVQSGL